MDGKFFQKIPQKSSKDSFKSSQNRCLGVVLGGLGASWGGLGASWGVLGASWGRLGASWGRLGASGARFSWDSILDTILYPICNRFGLDFATVETREKALRYYKNSIFEPLG